MHQYNYQFHVVIETKESTISDTHFCIAPTESKAIERMYATNKNIKSLTLMGKKQLNQFWDIPDNLI